MILHPCSMLKESTVTATTKEYCGYIRGLAFSYCGTVAVRGIDPKHDSLTLGFCKRVQVPNNLRFLFPKTMPKDHAVSGSQKPQRLGTQTNWQPSPLQEGEGQRRAQNTCFVPSSTLPGIKRRCLIPQSLTSLRTQMFQTP